MSRDLSNKFEKLINAFNDVVSSVIKEVSEEVEKESKQEVKDCKCKPKKLTINEYFKDLRKVYRLKLEQVKIGTGLNVSYISQIENDLAKPSMESIVKLCKFYQQDLEKVLIRFCTN